MRRRDALAAFFAFAFHSNAPPQDLKARDAETRRFFQSASLRPLGGFAPSREKPVQAFRDRLRSACLALPDHQYVPAEPFQLALLLKIAFAVSFELGPPPLGAGLGQHATSWAVVPVPETTVNLDRDPMARENDVGLAGQVAAVQAKAVPHAVEKRSHEHLRLSVLVPNPSHQLTAAFRV